MCTHPLATDPHHSSDSGAGITGRAVPRAPCQPRHAQAAHSAAHRHSTHTIQSGELPSSRQRKGPAGNNQCGIVQVQAFNLVALLLCSVDGQRIGCPADWVAACDAPEHQPLRSLMPARGCPSKVTRTSSRHPQKKRSGSRGGGGGCSDSVAASAPPHPQPAAPLSIISRPVARVVVLRWAGGRLPRHPTPRCGQSRRPGRRPARRWRCWVCWRSS